MNNIPIPSFKIPTRVYEDLSAYARFHKHSITKEIEERLKNTLSNAPYLSHLYSQEYAHRLPTHPYILLANDLPVYISKNKNKRKTDDREIYAVHPIIE